jgi:hypothetical protein
MSDLSPLSGEERKLDFGAVRSVDEGQSGKHVLAPSSSQFDPIGTFVTVRDPTFTGLQSTGQRKVAD